MDLQGGFRLVFLCFLSLRAVVAVVEPPSNVTLHCHNLHNVLNWSYAEPSTPGLRYRVDIGSFKITPRILWVDPPALQADLSFLSDPEDEYFVTVTAVAGGENSTSIPNEGITFSYYKGSMTEQKCFVDFPPLNVSAHDDGHVAFSFQHPWTFYRHKLPDSFKEKKVKKKKARHAETSQKLPMFTYKVQIVQEHTRHSFDCLESVCEGKLAVDAEKKKHCLSVNGDLEKMLVKGTQDYCAVQAPVEQKKYAHIIAPLVVIVLVALAGLLYMIYRKKTRAKTPFPSSISIKDRVKQLTSVVTRDVVLVPQVESIERMPLQTEENPQVSPTQSHEPELRLPTGVQDEVVQMREEIDEEEEEEEEVMERGEEGYRAGTELEEDPNGYRTRARLD